MKSLYSALILLSLLTCNALAAPKSTPVVAPTSNDLIGRPAQPWIVTKKHWTNTPKLIWLGGLQGHVTVIEFFRINCSHCQDAAPSRRALYQKYHEQGLEMVGFQSPGLTNDPKNAENNWAQVQRQIKTWGLIYPIAFDEDRTLFDDYKFQFYPTVLVLDRKGIVRFQQTGYSPEKARELEQFVAHALKSKS